MQIWILQHWFFLKCTQELRCEALPNDGKEYSLVGSSFLWVLTAILYNDPPFSNCSRDRWYSMRASHVRHLYNIFSSTHFWVLSITSVGWTPTIPGTIGHKHVNEGCSKSYTRNVVRQMTDLSSAKFLNLPLICLPNMTLKHTNKYSIALLQYSLTVCMLVVIFWREVGGSGRGERGCLSGLCFVVANFLRGGGPWMEYAL